MSYFLLSRISNSSRVLHRVFPPNFSYQSFREYLERKVEDKIRMSAHKIGSHQWKAHNALWFNQHQGQGNIQWKCRVMNLQQLKWNMCFCSMQQVCWILLWEITDANNTISIAWLSLPPASSVQFGSVR